MWGNSLTTEWRTQVNTFLHSGWAWWRSNTRQRGNKLVSVFSSGKSWVRTLQQQDTSTQSELMGEWRNPSPGPEQTINSRILLSCLVDRNFLAEFYWRQMTSFILKCEDLIIIKSNLKPQISQEIQKFLIVVIFSYTHALFYSSKVQLVKSYLVLIFPPLKFQVKNMVAI